MTAGVPETETVLDSPHPAGLAAAARLRVSPYAAVRSVACHCRGGVLILRGRLPSFYLKQVAQATVCGLEGVSRIDNQTEVEDGADRHARRRALRLSQSFVSQIHPQRIPGERLCAP